MKLIFVIYIVIASAWGDWSALLGASSVEDLLVLERQIDKVDEVKLRCRFQLKLKLFPVSCLEEIANGLERPLTRTGDSLDSLWSRVQRLCLHGADSLQSISQIKGLLSKQVPRTCQRALLLRLQDLKYLQGKKGTFLEISSDYENFNRSESQL